jgi:hypothetical protein
MLSEMSSDGAMLGNVKEDEDDEESTSDSAQANQQQQTADAKTIEMLTRENALLRQQQYQSSRLRPRASTAATYGLGNGYSVHDPVPEESDYAVDELDEMNDGQDPATKRAFARRMSEYAAGSYRSPYTLENRKLENVKRAIWQSSLGFGGLQDIPQSRRHSFADVPTRQPSISSMGEAVSLHEATSPDASQNPDFTGFGDASGFNTTSPGELQELLRCYASTVLTSVKCRTTLQGPISQAVIRPLVHQPMAIRTSRLMDLLPATQTVRHRHIEVCTA